MKGFNGFPPKGTLIKVPALFFSELLPEIDSLPELKVTLYCFWRLQQKEGQVVFIRRREILNDTGFMQGLGIREDQRHEALSEGLERAVMRGTLLHVQIDEQGRSDDLYFMNTARGRAAVEGIEKGQWFPDLGAIVPLNVTVERPNLYRLYEENIGPLTSLIAERLQDLEKDYPEAWIKEAIEAAAFQNKRGLRYIEKILEHRRDKGSDRDNRSQNAKRFITGKYGDEIEH
jgi:DNA replication protein